MSISNRLHNAKIHKGVEQRRKNLEETGGRVSKGIHSNLNWKNPMHLSRDPYRQEVGQAVAQGITSHETSKIRCDEGLYVDVLE